MGEGSSMKLSSSSKRARVTDLRRGAYATTRAVAALLKRAREEGIPEHTSASTQHRYRRASCARETPYGPLVQDLAIPENSVTDTISIQQPFAMLHVVCQETEMAAVWLDALAEYGDPSPQHPWRLIFYQDEVGIAPLKNKDSRHTTGFYWSFLEFGRRLLCTESAWFVICALRTEVVKELNGGVSFISKLLLRKLLVDTAGSLRTGIMLHIRGRSQPLLLFAELFINCADLDGFFKFCLSKGSMANVPCPWCFNIVSIKSKYALANNVLRAFDCLEKRDVIFHSDESIRSTLKTMRALAREVEAGRKDPSELAQMEQDTGYNHCDENVLLDDELDIKFASTAHCDWFHTYLQTDIFNSGAYITFLERQNPPITRCQIGTFVDSYSTATNVPDVSGLFHGTCISSDSVHFKCSASQGLTLYPILAIFFADVVPEDVCPRQTKSFLSLCDVLDCLVMTKEGIDAMPADTLEPVIMTHLHNVLGAYSNLFWALKFHVAAMHLVRQYRGHLVLISLFTHERRHKLLKRYIKDRHNTTSFERGLMEEVTLQHIYDLRTQWWRSELHDLRDPGRSLLDAWRQQFPSAVDHKVSSGCSLQGGATAKVGDVVALSLEDVAYIGQINTLGRVFQTETQYLDFACVDFWMPVAGAGTRYYKVMRAVDDPTFLPLECLLSALTVSRRPDGIVTCLIPASLRSRFGD